MPLTFLLAVANSDKPIALAAGGGFALLALALVLLGFWVGRSRTDERE